MKVTEECTIAITADSTTVIIDLRNLPYRKIIRLQTELPLQNLPAVGYELHSEDWMRALAYHLFVHIGESHVQKPIVDERKGTISFTRNGKMGADEIQLYINEFLALARFGSISVVLKAVATARG